MQFTIWVSSGQMRGTEGGQDWVPLLSIILRLQAGLFCSVIWKLAPPLESEGAVRRRGKAWISLSIGLLLSQSNLCFVPVGEKTPGR